MLKEDEELRPDFIKLCEGFAIEDFILRARSTRNMGV